MSILSVLILLNFGMDMNSFELYFGFDSSSSSMMNFAGYLVTFMDQMVAMAVAVLEERRHFCGTSTRRRADFHFC